MRERFCDGSSTSTGSNVLGIHKFDRDPGDADAFYVGGVGERFQKIEFLEITVQLQFQLELMTQMQILKTQDN